MSKYYDESDTFTFDTDVSIKFFYKSNPPRIEECHGLHEFNEDEEVGRETFKVEIILGEGEKTIDITDRLTKEELKQLANGI